MAGYVFHYACEGPKTRRTTCGHLERAFSARLRKMFPPAEIGDWDARPGAPAVPPGDPPGERGAPPGSDDPADLLADQDLWAGAAELQWAFASDRDIGELGLARTLSRLRSDGDLERVRRSCLRLAKALSDAYPSLKGEPVAVCLQLVAFGADIALGAASDPDFLLYAKNELQPVDLSAALDGS